MHSKQLSRTFALFSALFLTVPAVSAAAEHDSALVEFLKKTEIHAFSEAGYKATLTNDDANPTGVFTDANNDFSAEGEVVFEKGVEELWDVGFRTDLRVGTDLPEAITASGSGDPDDVDFEQAYIAMKLPFFDNSVNVRAGKFVTHIGWELIQGYDSLNDNITRSILFGFGIPFTHTGISATYQVADGVEFTLMGTNGWDSLDDNNDAKSICTQLIVNLTDDLTFYANGIYGPEQDDEDSEWRYLANLILEYAFDEKTTIVVNGIYGTEEDVDTATTTPAIIATTIGGVTAVDAGTVTVITEDDADWGAIAAYIRHQINETFACTVRGEYFRDDDGSRTGLAQDLAEVTATLEAKINENARVRLEGRYDHSDENFFEAGTENNQFLVALNAQFWF